MTFIEMLPIIVNLLLIILLIILIILGIKLIFVVDKTEKLIDDVQMKVKSFDSVFNFVNIVSEKLTLGVSNVVELIMGFVNKIFRRKEKDLDE